MSRSLLTKRNINVAASIVFALIIVSYQAYTRGSWQVALQPEVTPTPVVSPIAALVKTASPSGEVAGLTLETAQVARVIDGDTIQLADGRKVRYIGMDTPETVDPRRAVGCFGKEASARNTELVADKTVELEKDISETDKYGRLLRYVYVDGQFINQVLVEEGYAHVSTYPPDVKYQAAFTAAETAAREAGKGLWGSVCEGKLPKSYLK